MRYTLEPEVPGGWGTGIEVDNSCHPPIVKRLHIEFDGWCGDELLECYPCFIVSLFHRRLLPRSVVQN